MTLSAIEAVRLKTSDKSVLTREQSIGDGDAAYYKLGHGSILASPALQLWKDDVLQTPVVDYSIDIAQGVITFVVTPVVNAKLDFQYYWSVFSDAEVQYFLDEATDNVTIASARLLLAWAADGAKAAKRQTLSGGGGLGQTVIDTSVVVRELRATAEALIKMEHTLGESIPAEGLTEVPWTEAYYRRGLEQHIIRES